MGTWNTLFVKKSTHEHILELVEVEENCIWDNLELFQAHDWKKIVYDKKIRKKAPKEGDLVLATIKKPSLSLGKPWMAIYVPKFLRNDGSKDKQYMTSIEVLPIPK